MLSIFETLEDESYIIWTVDSVPGLVITATNGQQVWRSQGIVSADTDKPASRKHEPDDSFMMQLRQSLSKSASPGISPYEVEFKLANGELLLSVKETLGTTSTKSLLFKNTLQPVQQPQAAFKDIFMEISTKMYKDEVNTVGLKKTISEYTKQIEILSNNTKEMGTMKDKLQDELISKMCMVLNCKKREIERLNERIAELESVANTSEHGSSIDMIDLTEGPSFAAPAAKKTTAAKAPAKPRAPRAKAGGAAALRGGGGTSISVNARGSKRKAAASTAAPAASADRSTAKTKRRRTQSTSESDEASDDGSDEVGSLVDFIVNEEDEGDDSDQNTDKAHSDAESDLSDANLPKVTPSSPSAQSQTALDGAGGRKKSNTKSDHANAGGAEKAARPVAVTLSLPISADTLPAAKGTDNDDSDLDGPIIKPRKGKSQSVVAGSSSSSASGGVSATAAAGDIVRTVTKGGATQGGGGSSNSAAIAPSISTGASATAVTAKSKFYAEDSEDEGNCMNYM